MINVLGMDIKNLQDSMPLVSFDCVCKWKEKFLVFYKISKFSQLPRDGLTFLNNILRNDIKKFSCVIISCHNLPLFDLRCDSKKNFIVCSK